MQDILADGRLLFQADTDKDNLITWILTFREKAVLLEPNEIREDIKKTLDEMIKNYM